MQYSTANVFCQASQFQESNALDIGTSQIQNPFPPPPPLNWVHDLCNLMAVIIFNYIRVRIIRGFKQFLECFFLENKTEENVING